MKPLGERLSQFAKKKGFRSVRQFEIDADLPNGFVGKSISITKARQLQLQSVFPDLNINWLLTGDGEMIKASAATNVHGDNNVIGDNNNVGSNITITHAHKEERERDSRRPIIPKYLATRPNTDVYKEVRDNLSDLNLDSLTTIPPYNNFDFYYQVRQDAMIPLYKEGDLVALLHTERGSDIIQGAAMIIDTNDFGFLLRRIYDRGEYYECRRINENSAFENQNIAKTKVIRLYRIVYSVRLGD